MGGVFIPRRYYNISFARAFFRRVAA